MSALSDLVNRRLQEIGGLSNRGMAAASGGLMSHGTAAKIVNGRHGKVEEQTIIGLARALQLPESTIRRTLGLPAKQAPFVLPDRANRLTQRQRSAIMRVIDAMLVPVEGELEVKGAVAREGHAKDAEEVAAIARRVRKNQTHQ
jgi:hypothetical protein